MAAKLRLDSRGQERTVRRDTIVLGVAALVSLLLSPLTAVWALVLGVPAVAVGWLLAGAGTPWARGMVLVAAGVLLGTVPYYVLAVLAAA